MKVCFSSVICFLFFMTFPNFLIAQAPPKVEEMTLEQKVGQLFIIGFPQQKMDPQLEDFIKKYKLSSFILFKRNISSLRQVAKMNAELQTLAESTTNTTPLIAVDQEGGQVARVPTKPQIPNAMSIGQTQNSELARSLGQETAKIIRTLGFNMNLAPVLDISNPESDSFIGQRSFGSDADKVSSIGLAVSRGLLDEDVIPTAKHFPGVGSVTGDPHKVAVESAVSAQAFFEKDLKPFAEFSKLGPNTAIMLSHLSYPSLDPSNTPATLSPEIIKTILRKKIGYTGLVVTDDIQMKGLAAFKSPHDAALAALKAGADLVMMTWSFKDQAKAIERVLAAVKSGELSEEELTEKVSRIVLIKDILRKARSQPGFVPNSKVVALTTKRLRDIESKILDFNIKLALKGVQAGAGGARSPSAISSDAATGAGPICVFSPIASFLTSIKKSTLNIQTVRLAPKHTAAFITTSLQKLRCGFGVFVVYGSRSSALLASIPNSTSEKLVVVNLSTPNLVTTPERYLNVVNLFFAHPDAGKRVADNLSAFIQRGPLKSPSSDTPDNISSTAQ